jgi:FkbM family methyltransferase
MDTDTTIVEVRPAFFAKAPAIKLHPQGGRDYLVRVIREGGIEAYERPTLALFSHLVACRGGTVLDVGANTGLFSLLAAAANPGAKVCAFEPLATVYQMLEDNLALNPLLRSRIVTSQFGFSDCAGKSTFYETINAQGFVPTSSTLERARAHYEGEFREHTIILQTLDEWTALFRGADISVIKIDVEGHEHAVLSGGRRLMAQQRPFLIVEMLESCRFDVINRLLIEQNYVSFAIGEEALRYCAMPKFHNDAWNHLLCPAEMIGLVLDVCRALGLGIEFR